MPKFTIRSAFAKSFDLLFYVIPVLSLSILYAYFNYHKNVGLFIKVISVFASIVTILAFVYTLRSAYSTTKKLRDITETISTRYIGHFPDHLDDLAELVGNARKSIRVFMDCVDYGSLYPRYHDALLSSLRSSIERRKKIDFEIIVWGEPQFVSRANMHYDAYKEAVGSGKSDDALINFIRNFGIALEKYRGGDFLRSNKNEFFEFKSEVEHFTSINSLVEKFTVLMAKIHAWEARLLWVMKSGAKIYGHCWNDDHGVFEEIAVKPPPTADFFFWIRDDEEAVILIPCHSQQALAFVTRENALVQHLITIFAARKRIAIAAMQELASRRRPSP